MKPILYTIDGCVECFQVRRHLLTANIEFREKNLLKDRKSATEVFTLVGEVIAPVFVDGEKIVKGLDICHL
ncbi:hypothetical protein [Bacillus weihaiensis]|uniref:Glutaredoxin domain-containing protein n=1 Tax=Bacillus weihaiensis TaxID=1547283 RepID=A0A1L3MTT9_9BACI|nr:hypothetical protein [Bacillus weihaiensis]APH05757.1 hypothetical protein A9C19_14020 [Bacillus weihaiensis]